MMRWKLVNHKLVNCNLVNHNQVKLNTAHLYGGLYFLHTNRLMRCSLLVMLATFCTLLFGEVMIILKS